MPFKNAYSLSNCEHFSHLIIKVPWNKKIFFGNKPRSLLDRKFLHQPQPPRMLPKKPLPSGSPKTRSWHSFTSPFADVLSTRSFFSRYRCNRNQKVNTGPFDTVADQFAMAAASNLLLLVISVYLVLQGGSRRLGECIVNVRGLFDSTVLKIEIYVS